MNVLIACEESQEVCKAFRARGHNAYSCDIQACSGGHPEWHIQGDVLIYLDGNIEFRTSDGQFHFEMMRKKWDLIIAHPPCTKLTCTGNRWFNVEKYGDKAIQRIKEREAAADFFLKFTQADCPRIVIENPVGYMSTYYRKPDQIIQPWQFGHNCMKTTCLWYIGDVKHLIPLVTEKPEMQYTTWYDEKTGRTRRMEKWYRDSWNLPPAERAKARSKTFPGIARAMAEQWG